MLKKLYAWIASALNQRHTYRELRHLDDRMLRDIGLDRTQFGSRF